ncbi:MAG: hypothetical protein ACOC0E_11540 [Spirochaetota bacterium]
MEPHVDKRTRDQSAFFTVWWSPLMPLTKRVIAGRVPSLPGVFEIYRDEGGRLPELVGRSRAYYGGLRNTFRGLIDETSPYPLNGRPLDQRLAHFLRYAVVESPDDMDDILYFFAARTGNEEEFDDSGRYEFIYLKEELLRPDGRPR